MPACRQADYFELAGVALGKLNGGLVALATGAGEESLVKPVRKQARELLAQRNRWRRQHAAEQMVQARGVRADGGYDFGVAVANEAGLEKELLTMDSE